MCCTHGLILIEQSNSYFKAVQSQISVSGLEIDQATRLFIFNFFQIRSQHQFLL